jgi:TctA family transporter
MWQALGELLTLQHFLYLSLGIVVGMVVGVLPGMGGRRRHGPPAAIRLRHGSDIGARADDRDAGNDGYGRHVPSILMGIPGGSSSATVLDGFPLSRQGHAARALSASFTASMLGGLLGTLVLTGCVFVRSR